MAVDRSYERHQHARHAVDLLRELLKPTDNDFDANVDSLCTQLDNYLICHTSLQNGEGFMLVTETSDNRLDQLAVNVFKLKKFLWICTFPYAFTTAFGYYDKNSDESSEGHSDYVEPSKENFEFLELMTRINKKHWLCTDNFKYYSRKVEPGELKELTEKLWLKPSNKNQYEPWLLTMLPWGVYKNVNGLALTGSLGTQDLVSTYHSNQKAPQPGAQKLEAIIQCQARGASNNDVDDKLLSWWNSSRTLSVGKIAFTGRARDQNEIASNLLSILDEASLTPADVKVFLQKSLPIFRRFVDDDEFQQIISQIHGNMRTLQNNHIDDWYIDLKDNWFITNLPHELITVSHFQGLTPPDHDHIQNFDDEFQLYFNVDYAMYTKMCKETALHWWKQDSFITACIDKALLRAFSIYTAESFLDTKSDGDSEDNLQLTLQPEVEFILVEKLAYDKSLPLLLPDSPASVSQGSASETEAPIPLTGKDLSHLHAYGINEIQLEGDNFEMEVELPSETALDAILQTKTQTMSGNPYSVKRLLQELTSNLHNNDAMMVDTDPDFPTLMQLNLSDNKATNSDGLDSDIADISEEDFTSLFAKLGVWSAGDPDVIDIVSDSDSDSEDDSKGESGTSGKKTIRTKTMRVPPDERMLRFLTVLMAIHKNSATIG